MKKSKLIWIIVTQLIFIIFILIYLLLIKFKEIKIENNNHQNVSQEVPQYKVEEEDVSFSENLEYEKHKKNIENRILKYNNSQVPELRVQNLGMSEDDNEYFWCFESRELIDLFYSSREGAYLYLESVKTNCQDEVNVDLENGPWYIDYDTYYLIDFSSEREIEFNDGSPFLQIIHRGEIFNSEEDVNKLLLEFR